MMGCGIKYLSTFKDINLHLYVMYMRVKHHYNMFVWTYDTVIRADTAVSLQFVR